MADSCIYRRKVTKISIYQGRSRDFLARDRAYYLSKVVGWIRPRQISTLSRSSSLTILRRTPTSIAFPIASRYYQKRHQSSHFPSCHTQPSTKSRQTLHRHGVRAGTAQLDLTLLIISRSVVLPHLVTGWHVDQAIMSEEERLVIIRFGRDWDPDCMRQDEVLYKIADRVKNFAVIYVCDLDQVPDFKQMYGE